jgi:hypothetical protein
MFVTTELEAEPHNTNFFYQLDEHLVRRSMLVSIALESTVRQPAPVKRGVKNQTETCDRAGEY